MLSGGGDRSPEEPPGEAAAVAAVVDGAKAAVEGAPKSDEEIGDSVAPSIVFFSFILLNILSFSFPIGPGVEAVGAGNHTKRGFFKTEVPLCLSIKCSKVFLAIKVSE